LTATAFFAQWIIPIFSHTQWGHLSREEIKGKTEKRIKRPARFRRSRGRFSSIYPLTSTPRGSTVAHSGQQFRYFTSFLRTEGNVSATSHLKSRFPHWMVYPPLN
jgi:hypothetical protein